MTGGSPAGMASGVELSFDGPRLVARRVTLDHVEAIQSCFEGAPDYFARNPWSGYCMAVVAPKVAKARKKFFTRLKR